MPFVERGYDQPVRIAANGCSEERPVQVSVFAVGDYWCAPTYVGVIVARDNRGCSDLFRCFAHANELLVVFKHVRAGDYRGHRIIGVQAVESVYPVAGRRISD